MVLGTSPDWVRDRAIQVAVLVAMAMVYGVGAICRRRHGNIRRITFYVAAGMLFGLWEWHMVWEIWTDQPRAVSRSHRERSR